MALTVVLTAGGTREPIDDVRFISNAATGALPAAMADALLELGHRVHYIHGPGALLPGRATLEVDLTALDAAALGTATARWLVFLRMVISGGISRPAPVSWKKRPPIS